ncbi:hypothetical protein RHGRI_035333 [Rhododendron griersonianum]|uniref:Sulfotransferase n=1 Tax=Rhododendron griersonianum TaxID=479676 RepID=A0AAV6I4S2_9ERIC|nr:hypothetical protein RHGRI_035333 [Rhododendron griersonianum]
MESSSNTESCDISETTCNGKVDLEEAYPPKSEGTVSIISRGNGLLCPEDFGLFQYEGFWYHSFYLEGVKLAQEQFKPQSTDIFLCSAPKSGTTWLKALAFSIVTRTEFNFSTNPLLVKVPHDCVPMLEVDIVKNMSDRNPEFPLLSTHMPYSSLPKSIIDSGCRVVYICRDPKDVFVSFWHFICKARPEIGFLPMDVIFELFCQGVSYYGPYWDHVLGYWKASLEQPERVLFLKYEDMKRETSVLVKRLAEFIGHPFSVAEETEGVVERVMDLCSFENLSNLEVNKNGRHRVDTPVAIENNTYFRRGKVRDWKNHLTAEMVQRMDWITEQKLGSCGLMFGGDLKP